jgi:phage terminase large subunit GpA-like protein
MMTSWLSSIAEQARRWLRPLLTNNPPLNVWQWAAEHVDFGLALNYDTPLHERYDPDFMPFWKDPAAWVTDPSVKEIIALKCARAGGSENLLLNPIRYAVAVRPQPTLYVTGDQLSAESMMEERIKRGLRTCRLTARKLNVAQATQHRIMFADMDLFVTWPRARQAFKQRGYGLVLCDELSTWPEFSADMARKRTASYPFAHIVFISSPDPQQKRGSDDDPIFVEYRRGDQCRWYCPDPRGGEFVFEMGGKDTPHGLKWDRGARREDGTWDLDKVKTTAHYVTPSGAIIHERDRMPIARAGRWVASNQDAPGDVRSVHVNAFMTPFDSLGGIAVAFLKANAAGPQALRTFVYEYLAEPWYGEKTEITVNQIEDRRGAYRHGTKASALPAYAYLAARRGVTLMTVDVQKAKLYCLVREWFDGGDSALVEWRELTAWKDVAAIKAKHGVKRVFIDLGYTERRDEVLEQCIYGEVKGAIPMFGRDTLKDAVKADERDPFEGTGRASGRKVPVVTFNPDQIKHNLSRLIDGEDPHQWLLPSDIDNNYIMQATSEECIDGAWVARRRDNHLWDCEVMQLAAAMTIGTFRQVGLMLDEPAKTEPKPEEKPQQVRQPVYSMPLESLTL